MSGNRAPWPGLRFDARRIRLVLVHDRVRVRVRVRMRVRMRVRVGLRRLMMLALAVSGGAASVAPSGAANRSFGSEVTVQATDRATGQATGPWLVVAPTSVVANWAAEARKFTPGLRVATVDATRKRRGAELAALAHDVDILITSYTLLRLEYEDYAALRPVGMVLDEAQQAKNPASKTFSSLVKVGAPVVYAITGTPMENESQRAVGDVCTGCTGPAG